MKISLITVSLNSSETLQATFNSIGKQQYPKLEYIIVDGGSKDTTVDLIKQNQGIVSKWVSEPDLGIYDAMNKGILMASGDIIGMLNSDDSFYDASTLKKIVAVFEQHPEVQCVYGNLILVNKEQKVIRSVKSKPFQPGLFAKSWTPAHPTFYCRRELYEDFGLYKTNYKIAGDAELMLRFLEVKKVKSFYLDEVLVTMSSGGVSNRGIKSILVITQEIKKAFKENEMNFNLLKYLFYKFLKIKEFVSTFKSVPNKVNESDCISLKNQGTKHVTFLEGERQILGKKA
jgi:glycosyltransferase involved in cell wall biosynthesis